MQSNQVKHYIIYNIQYITWFNELLTCALCVRGTVAVIYTGDTVDTGRERGGGGRDEKWECKRRIKGPRSTGMVENNDEVPIEVEVEVEKEVVEEDVWLGLSRVR